MIFKDDYKQPGTQTEAFDVYVALHLYYALHFTKNRNIEYSLYNENASEDRAKKSI
jgi:hypothetical protein